MRTKSGIERVLWMPDIAQWDADSLLAQGPDGKYSDREKTSSGRNQGRAIRSRAESTMRSRRLSSDWRNSCMGDERSSPRCHHGNRVCNGTAERWGRGDPGKFVQLCAAVGKRPRHLFMRKRRLVGHRYPTIELSSEEGSKHMKIVFATWRLLVGSRHQNRGLRRRGSDAAILSIA